MKHREQQAGQALILGLAVLLLGLLSLLFLFNAGLAVRQKTELTNAADASAMVAGLEQARAMNFIAYANRGIVANEIAVGQTVALQSWSQALDSYQSSAPAQVPAVCRAAIDWVQLPQMCLLPFLGMNSYSSQIFTGALAPAALKVHSDLWPALIKQSGQAQAALSAAQAAVAALMSTPAYLKDSILAVAGKNLSSVTGLQLDETLMFSAGQLGAKSSWSYDGRPLVYSYSGNERQHLTDAITRKAALKDGFLQPRAWTAKNLIASLNLGCLLFFKRGLPAVEIRRRGVTELKGVDDWESIDTIQGYKRYAYIPKHKILPRCGFDVYPISGGGASSGKEAFGLHTENAASDFSHVRNKVVSGQHKLPDFIDMHPELLAQSQPVRPRVLVRLIQPETASGGGTYQRSAGRLDLYSSTEKGKRISAVAVSEVYFDAAFDTDNNDTNAGVSKETEDSLLTPFWVPRLVDLNAAERALLLQQQGGLGL